MQQFKKCFSIIMFDVTLNITFTLNVLASQRWLPSGSLNIIVVYQQSPRDKSV
jgi:hypothetical protein